MSLRLYSCGPFALALAISLSSSGCQVPHRLGQNELHRRAFAQQADVVRAERDLTRPLLAQLPEVTARGGAPYSDPRQPGLFNPGASADVGVARLAPVPQPPPPAAHHVVTNGSTPAGPIRQTVHRASSTLKAPLALVGGRESGFDALLNPPALDRPTDTAPPTIPAQQAPVPGAPNQAAPDPSPQDPAQGQMPIDFPTVLRLAGGENWDVRLAYERIAEAQAELDRADLLWVPSVSFGLGYNKHEGQIQATEGEIIDISRNSLFVGGGAAVQNTAITGGAGGPARLVVDLSLADAYFQPLAQRQLFNAAQFQHATAFNDTLLEASLAYYDLARAQAGVVVATDNLNDAEQVELLTKQFVASGKGSEAEVFRIQAEVEKRRRAVVEARLKVHIVSAELSRILQLDPSRLSPETPLYAADDRLVPLELVSDAPLGDLIAQAHRGRPELADRWAQIQAACEWLRLEGIRPFVPNLYVGASGGGFGGGTGAGLRDFSGRGDFDVAAVWKLDNLGFGNHVAVDRSESQYRQSILQYHRIRDRISSEVLQSYHSVDASEQQIELARANVNAATESFNRNLQRIRGLEGLPIEALQTVTAVSEARQAYVDAVIDYNQSQLRLLRAIGRPLRQ